MKNRTNQIMQKVWVGLPEQVSVNSFGITKGKTGIWMQMEMGGEFRW